jgi:hypothetical protein
VTPRDEIRESEYGALACPSCGQMSAGILYTSHRLVLASLEDGRMLMECRDGIARFFPDDLDYDEVVAGANIALVDAVTFRFDQYMGLLTGPRKPEDWRPVGLIELLNADDYG